MLLSSLGTSFHAGQEYERGWRLTHLTTCGLFGLWWYSCWRAKASWLDLYDTHRCGSRWVSSFMDVLHASFSPGSGQAVVGKEFARCGSQANSQRDAWLSCPDKAAEPHVTVADQRSVVPA